MPPRYLHFSARPGLRAGFLREAHIWSKPQHDYTHPFLGVMTDLHLTVSIMIPWVKRGLRPRSTSLGILMRLEIIGGFIKSFTQIQWEIAQGLRYLDNHSSSRGQ